MNAKEIARAYGMPSRVASLIQKDPSQFKYWQKCGEEAYNGCLKWVDSRDSCTVCLLCRRCCRSSVLHAEIERRRNEPEPVAIIKPIAMSKPAAKPVVK